MTDESKISGAAKRLSKAGAAKGGRARANILTPEERSDIARQAVRARWRKAGKVQPDAADDRPDEEVIEAEPDSQDRSQYPYSMFRGNVAIGDVSLECHVLNDGRRVLTQREVVRLLSGGRESGNLARYLSRNPLIERSPEPIKFIVPPRGQPALGYEAMILIEICEAYLRARDENRLHHSQLKLAKMAEIIIRASAKVGIIALIDEATGYQEVRRKQELQLKLQAFIADDLQEWAKMFPDEFWYELARLEGIRYSPRSRPLRWGKYVMAFVYDTIDEDVGKALREKNPNPHYLQNHHQWLKKYGRQAVHDQIERVVTIMKLCGDMDDFRHKFARVFQKNAPLQMRLDDINWIPS